jgi:hypothetical protein
MNDIDTLMSKPLDELVPSDIDAIIAWHRAIREKPQKDRPAEEKLDLSKILGTVRKSTVPAGFVKRV